MELGPRNPRGGMRRLRLAAIALIAVLLWATIRDPYSWHLWVTYHTGIHAWWKLMISTIDVALLARLGWLVLHERWRQARNVSMLECVFAATAGLFVARQDLIRNAIEIDWLPGIRVALAIYIGSIGVRLVVLTLVTSAVKG